MTDDNEKRLDLSYEEVCGLAFSAAGAASVPFMRDHPHYVMPTEEISEGVAKVLADRGIDLQRIHGYGQALRPPRSERPKQIARRLLTAWKRNL